MCHLTQNLTSGQTLLRARLWCTFVKKTVVILFFKISLHFWTKYTVQKIYRKKQPISESWLISHSIAIFMHCGTV